MFMNNKFIALVLVILLVFTSLTIIPNTYATRPGFIKPQINKISPILKSILYDGKNIEGISIVGDVVKGKVIVSGNNLDTVLEYVKPYMVLSIPSGNTIIFGFYRLSDVEKLSSLIEVVSILPDPQPYYGVPQVDNFMSRAEIGVDLYTMRDILGVSRVEDVYGYTGDGVVIAVIDTGVDYGQPNIRDKLIIDEYGNPLVLDADAMGLTYPFYEFKAVNGFLQTANVTVSIFTGWMYWLDLFEADASYAWMTYTIPVNYFVGNITSASGVYKLGFQLNYLYQTIIPVLLVDSKVPGAYDTVYIDVSSIYKSIFLGEAPDYSFADETPYHKGDVIAEDFNGDDIPDISLGVIGGYFLDSMHYFGGGFKEGFPESGEYLLIFYDFYGHGTACASSISSSGILPYDVYGENKSLSLIGIARNAKILGINGLFNGFVEAAWFFAAGFDIIMIDSIPYLIYSGKPRADLTSNSWGISYYLYDYFVFGADFESILEMGFMTPGFYDPNFPGILMIHAGGNGGPGYGTVTSPGAASLVLTVGASTSFHWVKIQAELPIFFDYEGYYDNIIFWSLRGPTPLGCIKPDVVNIGAFGWVPGIIAGDGSASYYMFGGTSMATPLTAGVAALVIQALKEKGYEYNPLIIKSIIMSTAKDINYPAFIQGAGRVDAYNAVKLVVDGGIYAYSPDTWMNIYNQIYLPWLYLFGSEPPIDTTISMPNIFAGYLVPNETYVGTLSVINTYNMSVTVDVQDYELVKTGEYVYNFTSSGEEAYTIPFIKVFDPAEFADADFVVIDLYTGYQYFDPYNYYWYTTYHALVFGEWADLDGDGVIDDGEFARMNYAYSRANLQELTLNNPYKMMANPENNSLVLYVYRWSYAPYEVPVIVKITKYAKVDSPYISVPQSLELSAKETGILSYTVNATGEPGIHSGFIEIRYGNDVITVPISWSTLYVVDSLNFTIGGKAPDDTYPYDQYTTLGRQQWGWRYESGDWRFIHVYIPPTVAYGISMMTVTLEWQHPSSGYDFYVHTPFVIGYSDWGFYLGAGRHMWHTTLNETALIGWAYPSTDLWFYDSVIYTFAIRQYLYGGLFPAESYKISVSVTPAETFTISSLFKHYSFMIDASEDNPLYSATALLNVSSYLVSIVTGAATIKVIPAFPPHHLYNPLKLTIAVIRDSTDVPLTANIVYLGYREQPFVIKYYNVYYSFTAFRLETYSFYCFSA